MTVRNFDKFSLTKLLEFLYRTRLIEKTGNTDELSIAVVSLYNNSWDVDKTINEYLEVFEHADIDAMLYEFSPSELIENLLNETGEDKGISPKSFHEKKLYLEQLFGIGANNESFKQDTPSPSS